MNSSNDFQIVGENGVLNKKISTEKKFKFANTTWSYQNTIDLSMLDQDGSNKLKIKNHLCEMVGNKIKKITEIIFKNKKYIIQDHYQLELSDIVSQVIQKQPKHETKDPSSTNDSQNNKKQDKKDQKKSYIFRNNKNMMSDPQRPTQALSKTKNVTKNFCKAFKAFLKSDKVPERDPEKIREGLQSYNRVFQGQRYNNNSIKKLINDESLRDLFRYFLQTQARNWITESRINDKVLHEEAISIYLNLFERMRIEEDLMDSPMSDSEFLDSQIKQE